MSSNLIRTETAWWWLFSLVLSLACSSLAAADVAQDNDILSRYEQRSYRVLDLAKSHAHRALARASRCANYDQCPALECDASTTLSVSLQAQLNDVVALRGSLRDFHEKLLKHHLQLLENQRLTGKHSVEVQVALMWQRPFYEIGTTAFNVASIIADFTQPDLSSPAAMFNSLHEAYKDLHGTLKDLRTLAEPDILKAYEDDDLRKAKATQQRFQQQLERELGLSPREIRLREEQAGMMTQLLDFATENKVLDDLHGDVGELDLGPTSTGGANIVSTLSNISGIRDEMAKIKKETDPTELAKSKKQIGIAIALIGIRHAKEWAFKDMKGRIARMQELATNMAAQDVIVVRVGRERGRILSLLEAAEATERELRAAIRALALCRAGRFCRARVQAPGAVDKPRLFSQQLAFYVGRIEANNPKISDLINRSLNDQGRQCFEDDESVYQLPSPSQCPRRASIPKAAKPSLSQLPSLVSCNSCSQHEAREQRLREELSRLEAERRPLEDQLLEVLRERDQLTDQADALNELVQAQDGTGITSFDPLTRVRKSVSVDATGRVTVTSEYPDGRREQSHYQSGSSKKRIRQELALRRQIAEVDARKQPIEARLNQLELALDRVQKRLGSSQSERKECQRRCQQKLALVDQGDGMYALPDELTERLHSALLRSQPSALTRACSRCQQATADLSSSIQEANGLRRDIRALADRFTQEMARAKAILKQPSQRFSFSPSDLRRTDEEWKAQLCEAIGNEAAQRIIKRNQEQALSFGGATVVQLGAATKDSPATLRTVRRAQSKALEQLPKLKTKIDALRKKTTLVETLRAELKRCESKQCDPPLESSELTTAPGPIPIACNECRQQGALQSRRAARLSRLLGNLRVLQNQLSQLRSDAAALQSPNAVSGSQQSSAASGASSITNHQDGLTAKADEIADYRLPKARSKMREALIDYRSAQQQLLACNGNCSSAGQSASGDEPSDAQQAQGASSLLDVKLVRVIAQSGNNPMDTSDPVAATATDLGGSSSSSSTNNFLQACIGQSLTVTNTVFGGVVIFGSASSGNCEFFINTGGGESTLPLLLTISHDAGFRGRHDYFITTNGSSLIINPAIPSLTAGFGVSTVTHTVTTNNPDSAGVTLRFTLRITITEGSGGAFNDMRVDIINAEVF